eukprot:scaffold3836_cov87-Skeletonema_dohrnii-CCMP3373.AAC.5
MEGHQQQQQQHLHLQAFILVCVLLRVGSSGSTLLIEVSQVYGYSHNIANNDNEHSIQAQATQRCINTLGQARSKKNHSLLPAGWQSF